MVDFVPQVALQGFNTLALPARAEYFCTAASIDELHKALDFARQRALDVTVLGGGSNIIFAGDVAGLVIRLAISGIAKVGEEDEEGERVLVRVGAGENWHQLVLHCLHQQWYGLENLSLIPGCAGAAPIQNIGAYGVELAQRFVSLEAIDLDSGNIITLDRAACRFGYRDSVFKHELRGRVAITSITLALSRRAEPQLDYPELRNALSDIPQPTPLQVSATVCALRRAKLPDPVERPNAGSFFKNPVIPVSQAQQLKASHPDLPLYPVSEQATKIPAAWLIDRAGWKGVRRGPVGVHDRQALVLVHFGGGSGAELLQLAADIADDVARRFGVTLELEPAVIGGASAAGEGHSLVGRGQPDAGSGL